MQLVNLRDIESKELMPGYHGRFVHTDRMSIATWEIEAGSPIPQHSHPHEQVSHILSGEFEMTIDGKTLVLKAGDFLVIPGDVTHVGKALTNCRILDVWAPVREDYKKRTT